MEHKRLLIISALKDFFTNLSQQQKGIFFAILSSFFFAVRSSIIKSTPIDKIETLMVLRFLCDLLLLSPLFVIYRKHLKTQKMKVYFGRSILVAASIFCSIYGIRNLALVDALLLQYTLPLFIPLMLWIFHRQKVSLRSLSVLAMGFASIFLLIKPELDIFHLASFASLGVGVLGAIMAITLHDLTKAEHVVSILFYSTLLAGLFSAIPCIYSWEKVPLSVLLKYVIPISMVGLIHQYLITRAYALAAPQLVGGFIYFCILFSAIFGWLIWDEQLDSMKVAGGIFLIFSGLLMGRENNRKAESSRHV